MNEPEKICSKCGDSKPLSEFYWHSFNTCKKCKCEYRRTLKQGRLDEVAHAWTDRELSLQEIKMEEANALKLASDGSDNPTINYHVALMMKATHKYLAL